MSADTSNPRRALRRELRERRLALNPAQRIRAAVDLLTSLHELPGFGASPLTAGYWAVDGELSLHVLLAGPLARSYCLPRIQPDLSLRFVRWQPGQAVAANRFGIPEPTTGEPLTAGQLDLVLLPLLGFDRRGNRLGSGAGYYDRSLAPLRGLTPPQRPLLVGVGYSVQEVDAIAAAEWDVPLDFVATERELIRCQAADCPAQPMP